MHPDVDADPPQGARPELPLEGGTSNRGLVVRVGHTVRRPQSPTSSATHALLRHLEDVGFDGAPRYLGEDSRGREVLSYVPGDAAKAPHPPWALTDAALRSVAHLLRRFHEAVATFDPTPYTWPTSVPAAFRSGLVSHNDPNLDNVVFRDGSAVALIDFDLASPGSGVWDLGLAARLWVPLRAPEDVPDARRGRTRARLRAIVDAYEPPPGDRRRVVEAAAHTHDWCYGIVSAGARRGQYGYVEYWTPEAQERAERGRRWLADHAAALAATLT